MRPRRLIRINKRRNLREHMHAISPWSRAANVARFATRMRGCEITSLVYLPRVHEIGDTRREKVYKDEVFFIFIIIIITLHLTCNLTYVADQTCA